MACGVIIMSATEKAVYGYDERESKSLSRKNSVIQTVNSELTNHLPRIFSSEHIEDEYFHLAIQDIEEKLNQRFTQAKDKTIAKQHLAKTVQQYNLKNNAALPIPKPVVRHNPENTFKNSKWFKNSKRAVSCYFEWRKALDTRPSAKLFSKEELLTNVLYSAAVHGGQLCHEILESIKQQLHQPDLQFQSNGEMTWLDIVFSSKTFSHNHTSGDKTKVLRRWYIDPVTLGWLVHFLNHAGQIEKNYGVWTLFKNYIPGTDSFKKIKGFLEACIAIIEHHTDESLSQAHLNYMIGRVDASSLPIRAHSHFLGLTPLRQVTNLDEISLCTSNKSKGVETETKQNRQSVPIQFDTLIESVNNTFKGPSTREKPKKKQCLEQLNAIELSYTHPPIKMIIGWLLHVGKDNKVATIERYWRSFAKGWLIETASIDLLELDSDDWEELYLQIIEQQSSDKAKQYCADRLSQFHQYLMRIEDIPPIENAVFGVGIGDTTSFVRAMFIPEKAFSIFMSTLEKLDLSNEEIERLKVLYILAFRTGMRRSEITKIQLDDIEESTDCWIFVRNNKFGDNKTSSALRKIPLRVLLTDEEMCYFENYLANRKLIVGYTNALLFSTENDYDEPFSGSFVSNIANQLLSSIMGEHIIFHHFRHTALSRLQIILEDINLALEHTPYNKDQIAQIQFALGGFKDGQPHRDAYWAIAGFAGHLSPQTTFHSYLHLNELIIFNRLRYSTNTFSHHALQQITSLSRNLITRRAGGNELIPIDPLKRNIHKLLKKHINTVDALYINVEDDVVTSDTEQALKVKPASPTPKLCYQVLKLLENGGTIEEARIRFNLEESLIEKWMMNAIELANIKTTKGKSTAISNRRKTTGAGVVLTPPKPRSNLEKAAVTDMLKKARKSLVHPDKNISAEERKAFYNEQQEKLIWCIKYFFNRSNTSKQGVPFEVPKKFKTFYDFIIQIIDIKDIRLELYDLKRKKYYDDWSKISKSRIEIAGEVSGHKNMPFGKLVLSVRHPDEVEQAEKISADKYSSSSLRYLFHLLYVMLIK